MQRCGVTLARKPFVVLDAEMLSSSVWAEAAHVRLVWITLLILCDTEGYVGAALPGIARAAGVTLQEAQDALETLQRPDAHSRTKSHEGRRVAEAERGYQVLNFIEHLNRLSGERVKARDRMRRHRERKALKRSVTDGYVTIPAGSREKGIGNREQQTTALPIVPSMQGERGVGRGVANPLIGDRPQRESELLRHVAREAELTNRDPVEVMCEVTGYEGARTSKLNPASMTDDRLLNSLLDARARVARLEAKNGRQTV